MKKRIIVFIDPSVYNFKDLFEQMQDEITGLIVRAVKDAWGQVEPIKIFDLDHLDQVEYAKLREMIETYQIPLELRKKFEDKKVNFGE